MLHVHLGEPAEVRGSVLRVGRDERALAFSPAHAAFAAGRVLLGDGARAFEYGPPTRLLFRYSAGPLLLTQHWAGHVDGQRLRLFRAGRESAFALPLPGPPSFATDGRTLALYWPAQPHGCNFVVILDERGPRARRLALKVHHAAVDGDFIYFANATSLHRRRVQGDWAALETGEWAWDTELARHGLAAHGGVLLTGPPHRVTAHLGRCDRLGAFKLGEGTPWAFYDGFVLWRDASGALRRASLAALMGSRKAAARLMLRLLIPDLALVRVLRFM